MSFECLLVSRDPSVVCTVDRVLRDLSVSTKICLTHTKAFDELNIGSTDLFVIDWDSGPSSTLLHEIWKSRTRQKPTVVAVSKDDIAYIPGVHYVLPKPVTNETSLKSLKTAYSHMLLDHRRHARYPLMTSAEITDQNGETFPGMVVDIGEGGVGLHTKWPLKMNDTLSFRLTLSGAKRPILIAARVLWVRDYGRAGCEFGRIPPVDDTILRDWLTNRIRVKKPLLPV